MKLTFLGANRQVTGSCYLLEAAGLRIVIDCGLFQEREFQERNWHPLPIDAESIDIVLLTHGHLDHCGRLPRLVREGLRCPIHCTVPTADMAPVVMIDAGRLQSEDAAYKMKRHRRQRHKGPRPIVPLYTADDAKRVAPLFRSHAYNAPFRIGEHISVTFREAGHILGSSWIEVAVTESGRTQRIVFSGDLGQWDKPYVGDPAIPTDADFVVMESTYGDREHREEGDVEDQLEQIINEATARGGNILIPTFAVERAQELLFHLSRLRRQKRIGWLPVFLDSPMAIEVTQIFRRHRMIMDAQTREMMAAGRDPLDFPGLHLTHTVAQSKAINAIRGTAIILAGSGMVTGGRIKHHIANNIDNPGATLLFVGYQSPSTLGGQLLAGASQVRLFGVQRDVRMRVRQLFGLSAHADRADLLRWLGGLPKPPRLFLTHGEEEISLSLAREIEAKWGWNVDVPKYQQTVDLG